MSESNKSPEEGLPPFAIIIPCYNDGKYLPDAIASVAACDPSLIELLIVNDGSTDPQTLDYLRQLEGQGYRILHQDNRGLAAARNAGIAATSAPYILPLDSDNKLQPEYLTLSLGVFKQQPDVSVIYGDKNIFGYKELIERVCAPDYETLIKSNYIDACAPYKRSLWINLNGYDEKMRSGWEDWDFWLRAMSLGYIFYHINKPLFDYRLRMGSMAHKLVEKNAVQSVLGYINNKQLPVKYEILREATDHWQWVRRSMQKDATSFIMVVVKCYLRLLVNKIRSQYKYTK